MKNNSRWVIIDVETDGLEEPIHVVEVAGQLMNGWEPEGMPFRMLLNHNVWIPPEVVAIHGYSQAFLRQHGGDPRHVYKAFSNYARDYPLVAHNLSFDWNRCLVPEWSRLNVPQIGRRGFCAMTLARRVVSETRSYKLEALQACFSLASRRNHQAEDDVLTVVELFQRVYRPRLEAAQLETLESVSEFSRRSPIAKCREVIRAASSKPASVKKEPVRNRPAPPLPA